MVILTSPSYAAVAEVQHRLAVFPDYFGPRPIQANLAMIKPDNARAKLFQLLHIVANHDDDLRFVHHFTHSRKCLRHETKITRAEHFIDEHDFWLCGRRDSKCQCITIPVE